MAQADLTSSFGGSERGLAIVPGAELVVRDLHTNPFCEGDLVDTYSHWFTQTGKPRALPHTNNAFWNKSLRKQ